MTHVKLPPIGDYLNRTYDQPLISWEKYLQLSQEASKASFYKGWYEIIMGVGADHGSINAIVDRLIFLYCLSKGIPHIGFSNTSYRRPSLWECQPDSSYYIDATVAEAPKGSSIVDLTTATPPDLVIEIANTSVYEDFGVKRVLYEEMPVKEYWVVSIPEAVVIAHAMDGAGGSRRVAESQVLPGLLLESVTIAIAKAQDLDNAQLGQWWLQQVQAAPL